MKTLLLWVGLTLLVATSAFAQTKWQKTDKEVYTDICLEGLGHISSYSDRQEVCDCVLEKIMAKYPNRKTAVDKMTEEEFTKWGNDCEDDLLGSKYNEPEDDMKAKAVAYAQEYCTCSDLTDETAQKNCKAKVMAKINDYVSGMVGQENRDTFKNVAVVAMMQCMMNK